MSGYHAEKMCEGFWRIRDSRQDCCYLIEGDERAAVIDTCMSDEPLLPMLETLTDKPIDLILTHAHIDHMYRAEEFRKVYVHEREKACYTKGSARLTRFGSMAFRVNIKKYPVHSYACIAEGEEFDLGNVTLKCIGAFGHTPGSMILVDEAHKAVICGDAVGSGSGVWMFLPDCTSVADYADSLDKTVKALEPYRDFTYYGGHYGQSSGEYSYPLSYGMFDDMRALCRGILGGEIASIPIKKLPLKFLLYYRYKTAAILTRRSKLK